MLNKSEGVMVDDRFFFQKLSADAYICKSLGIEVLVRADTPDVWQISMVGAGRLTIEHITDLYEALEVAVVRANEIHERLTLAFA